MGEANKTAIATLVERATRYTMLVHLPEGHDAEVVRDGLIKTISTLPTHLRGSLTWDQGAEMARHKQFSMATDMAVYFCDPASPWQRGTNENTNGLLRQYFPKGTDLSVFGPEDLEHVAQQLNGRPRKTLDWDSPAERLRDLLEPPKQQAVLQRPLEIAGVTGRFRGEVDGAGAGRDGEVVHPRLSEIAGPRTLVTLVDRTQIGLEVFGERLWVFERDVFGPVLDEEVERVDDLHIGDQPDGDGQAAGSGREHQAGQEISECVLLPVDEVIGGLDLQRVGLDRGPRVRRGAQPNDVGMHLHQPIERVAGAMLQRHLDAHDAITSQGDKGISRASHAACLGVLEPTSTANASQPEAKNLTTRVESKHGPVIDSQN